MFFLSVYDVFAGILWVFRGVGSVCNYNGGVWEFEHGLWNFDLRSVFSGTKPYVKQGTPSASWSCYLHLSVYLLALFVVCSSTYLLWNSNKYPPTDNSYPKQHPDNRTCCFYKWYIWNYSIWYICVPFDISSCILKIPSLLRNCFHPFWRHDYAHTLVSD